MLFKVGTKKLAGAVLVFAPMAAIACSAVNQSSEDVASSDDQAVVSCGNVVQPNQDDSLFVVDPTALGEFTLEAVLDQIVSTGAQGSGLTAQGFYDQLFDTLNDSKHAVTKGPHCDDNGGLINGFPQLFCPRQEGTLAGKGAFNGNSDPNSYHPTGIINRFDLAPQDGSNCGQYRVSFAKNSGVPGGTNRVLLIFEAVLPNPHPEKGLAACAPVANFWDQLTNDSSATSRAQKLHNFYFKGIGDFGPVIKAQNYALTTGQIRANLFMFQTSGQEWELREFHLAQACTGAKADGGGECALTAINTSVFNNPDGTLFTGTDPLSQQFQGEFISQVATLASGDVNTIAMSTPSVDNAPESAEQDNTSNYGVLGPENTALDKAVTKQLKTLGITNLSAQNIFDRATTQSCAGCHETESGHVIGPGNATWPRSNGFTQIDENATRSPALTGTFLPFRGGVLFNFLESVCKGGTDSGVIDPTRNIGGGLVGSAN